MGCRAAQQRAEPELGASGLREFVLEELEEALRELEEAFREATTLVEDARLERDVRRPSTR